MKIKNNTLVVFLHGSGSGACQGGRAWALANCATLREVWEKCPRSDWMLWMLRRLIIYDKSVSRFLVKMLREQPIKKGKTLFDLMTDERSRACVDVLEKFLNGKAAIEEVRNSLNADAAAYSAASAAAPPVMRISTRLVVVWARPATGGSRSGGATATRAMPF